MKTFSITNFFIIIDNCLQHQVFYKVSILRIMVISLKKVYFMEALSLIIVYSTQNPDNDHQMKKKKNAEKRDLSRRLNAKKATYLDFLVRFVRSPANSKIHLRFAAIFDDFYCYYGRKLISNCGM